MRSAFPTPFRPGLLFAAALAATGLAACAHPPPPGDTAAAQEYREANDPLEPTNRVFYAINNGIDTVILRPLAIGYRHAVPVAVRNHLHNMLVNFGTPVTFANDVMEFKPRRAGDSFMRFLINSTVGLGGIFDVASGWGYPQHDAGFGITLALWGLPNGPFLFLPVLGPSSPRDATGFGVDLALDPFFWPPAGHGMNAFRWSRTGLSAVDSRERVLDQTDEIKKQALDPYATFRSLYQQHRQSQIDDAKAPEHLTVPNWFSRR